MRVSFKGKLVSGLVLMIMVLMLGSMTVFAGTTQNENLATNDQWVSGTLSNSGDVALYKMTLPKAGWLTVTYQGWSLKDSYYQLWNEDLDRNYYKQGVYGASNTNPKTSASTRVMEAGVYYVKVYGVYTSSTGDYRLKAAFEAASNTETEPNNSFEKAMTLSPNKKVTGLISEDDTIDFYEISVPSEQKITITYNAKIGDSYIELWDSDYTQVLKQSVYSAKESAPITKVIDQNLAKGKYFIKIIPVYGSSRGRYDISWTGPNVVTDTGTKVKSITLGGFSTLAAGKSKQLSTSIKPSNATNKTLTWKSSSTAVATVSSKGVVKGVKAGKVTITATAKDGSEVKGSKVIVILPKKLSNLAVTPMGSKKIKMTWSGQKGATGYQIAYSQDAAFEDFTSSSYNNPSVLSKTLTTPSKGSYYVKMRAYVTVNSKKYYGAWSDTVKVYVK